MSLAADRASIGDLAALRDRRRVRAAAALRDVGDVRQLALVLCRRSATNVLARELVALRHRGRVRCRGALVDRDGVRLVALMIGGCRVADAGSAVAAGARARGRAVAPGDLIVLHNGCRAAGSDDGRICLLALVRSDRRVANAARVVAATAARASRDAVAARDLVALRNVRRAAGSDDRGVRLVALLRSRRRVANAARVVAAAAAGPTENAVAAGELVPLKQRPIFERSRGGVRLHALVLGRVGVAYIAGAVSACTAYAVEDIVAAGHLLALHDPADAARVAASARASDGADGPPNGKRPGARRCGHRADRAEEHPEKNAGGG